MPTRTYTGLADIFTDAAGWDGGTLPAFDGTEDLVISGDGALTGAGELSDGESIAFVTLTVDPTNTGAYLTCNGTVVLTGTILYPSWTSPDGQGVVNYGTLTINGNISQPYTTLVSGGNNPMVGCVTGSLTINGNIVATHSQSMLYAANQCHVTVNGNVTSSSDSNSNNAVTATNGAAVVINGNVDSTGGQFAVNAANGGYVTVKGNISASNGGEGVFIGAGGILNTVSTAGRTFTSGDTAISIANYGGIWLTGENDTINDPNIVAGTKYVFPSEANVRSGIAYYDGSFVGTEAVIPTAGPGQTICYVVTRDQTGELMPGVTVDFQITDLPPDDTGNAYSGRPLPVVSNGSAVAATALPIGAGYIARIGRGPYAVFVVPPSGPFKVGDMTGEY